MSGNDERGGARIPAKRMRLTGNALLARMQEFFDDNGEVVGQLKVTTTVEKERALVHVIRCDLHERFLGVLKDEMITGHLQNQHNVTSLFLVVVLKGGSLANLKVRNVEGTEIDVFHAGKCYELKTKKDIDVNGIPGFIGEYFEEIVENQSEKHIWWLVFMLRRAGAKGKIGTGCMYYMVVIEVDAVGLGADDRDGLTSEVMKLVQKVQERVSKEDESDKSKTTAFVTVDNVWVVDRMREKLQATEEENAELKEENVELEKELSALKKEMSGLKKENIGLKKRLDAMEKLLRDLKDKSR